MKTKLIFFSLALFFIVSCKKDDTPTPEQPAVNNDTIEKLIEIKTSYGNMYMWLYKGTPLHRNNFLGLSDTNYFDSTTFHRCITNFMIQGGDPNSKDADKTNDGTGGPGYTIPAEINSGKYTHKRGAIGAARTNNPEKASSGSQFYIVLSTSGAAHLNGQYTVFGEIIKGIEVADSIVKQPQDPANNRPYTDIKMDVNVITRTTKQLREEFNFSTFDR
jgi:cyclophilin family peptidyl-prolyl cis-trans isomerase